MAFRQLIRSGTGSPGLTQSGALSTLERITVLVVIVGVIAVDLFGIIFSYGPSLPQSLLSIATTIVFALYLWSPWVATAALGIVFALSFVAGTQSAAIFAAAVAVGLVVRLGRMSLILSYAGAFLVATAIVGYSNPDAPVNVGIYLIIATVAGAIGFALRLALDKGRRLEQELAERAEHEREAVLAERRWIAGELHDSIAHHLTVVALHVQMLDDPERSRDSQDAIRVAARTAMTDLRFVIELADDGPRSSAVHSGDLATAIDEAQGEIEAAGHAVVSEGDARDERIHRAGEIILARIMRESATNILKHAGPGDVSIRLDVDDEALTLEIRSPLPATPRRDLPSSRTGVNRMAERVLGASGEFTAGAVDGQWRVSASLPIN
ncbi:sensor histidine kinase [Microbacterium sp. TWP3-1-2b2]|uniref:sensor histidine kinase n=1 Tax=Microbacterium sp. TWP3-1-2b2 TaxID=2804651 RepID=UPI003CF1F546